MEEKKIVRIETEVNDKDDVIRETTTCDTAIIMTVENTEEIIDSMLRKEKGSGVTVHGKTMFLGMNIPDWNFTDIVSNMFADIIEKKVRKNGKGVGYAAFMIHEVAEALEKYAIELMDGASKGDLEQEIKGAVKGILEIIDQVSEKAAGKKAEE